MIQVRRTPLIVQRLGSLPFAEAWDLQRRLVQERKEGAIPDHLLLLEHASVYTLGRRGDLGHIRVGEGECRRGGCFHQG